MKHTCRRGDLKIVRDLVENKGVNNWNDAMFGACEGGHIHIVEYINEKIENDDEVDWDLCLYIACDEDHSDIVDFLVNQKSINNWGEGLLGAASGGHLKWVRYMEQKGIDDDDVWNEAFRDACVEGHLHVVQYIMDKANDWTEGFSGASQNNQRDVIDYLLSVTENINETRRREYLNHALKGALCGVRMSEIEALRYIEDVTVDQGRFELIKYLIERGADPDSVHEYYFRNQPKRIREYMESLKLKK